jgi:hypothetical protein
MPAGFWIDPTLKLNEPKPPAMNFFMRTVFVCLCVFSAGCVGIRYSDPVVAVANLSPGEEVTCRVLAKAEEWRNSGLTVTVGNKYRIQAEGRWFMGGFASWTGPDGVGCYNALCWDTNIKILQGYSNSALIGKLGEQGQPFAVLNAYDLTPASDGVLYFRINDGAGFCGDNDGLMTVKISLLNPRPEGMNPVAAPAGSRPAELSLSTLKVVSYQYDAQSQKGSLSVDISGHGIEAREWVVKNIGKICSSKEVLLEAGQENSTGGRYRVLNESLKDGILTIEFTAGFSDR